MIITISLLALLATFYQLHLQRIHNEKSLKPLAQIDFVDRDKLAVHIQNNGVGPLIVNKLTFFKDEKTFHSIKDCLTIDPKSYQHILITDTAKKVIMAGTYFEIFSTIFDEEDTIEFKDKVRRGLASITLIVEGKDIYDNNVTVERKLDWFLRHYTT